MWNRSRRERKKEAFKLYGKHVVISCPSTFSLLITLFIEANILVDLESGRNEAAIDYSVTAIICNKSLVFSHSPSWSNKITMFDLWHINGWKSSINCRNFLYHQLISETQFSNNEMPCYSANLLNGDCSRSTIFSCLFLSNDFESKMFWKLKKK